MPPPIGTVSPLPVLLLFSAGAGAPPVAATQIVSAVVRIVAKLANMAKEEVEWKRNDA